MSCLYLALACMISAQGLLPLSTAEARNQTIDPKNQPSDAMNQIIGGPPADFPRNQIIGLLPSNMGPHARTLAGAGQITLVNNSDQLIKAICDSYAWWQNGGEFFIGPARSETWNRPGVTLCRFCAYSNWHDYWIASGTTVILTPDFKFVANGYVFGDAKIDGPHL